MSLALWTKPDLASHLDYIARLLLLVVVQIICNPNLPPAARGVPHSGTSVEAKLYPRLPVDRNSGAGQRETKLVSLFRKV